jgi:hypothetical protein
MKRLIDLLVTLLLCITLYSCANIGTPDGGIYDEIPPKLIGSTPVEGAVNSTSKKIVLRFDEYIKLENANDKVVVSPPQLEAPEIKTSGKSIIVNLQDTLQPNTTYTVDFSDAIVDNNEGNPMGQYTYTFSTGEQIDSMEISGYVLDASNLEPIKGLLVGLHTYADENDTAFTTKAFERVSRTDGSGKFRIKGINGDRKYRVYALKDANGNYFFDQKSEQIAFNPDSIVCSSKPDVRMDTVWRDSTHYDSIRRIPYTHFYPDNIVLKAFTEEVNNRYFIKWERSTMEQFKLFFSCKADSLPIIKGLNFDERDAFVIEHNPDNDSLVYWVKDTAIYYMDTLAIAMTYIGCDSLLQPISMTDTLEIVSSLTRAKMLKQQAEEREEWIKQYKKDQKRKNRREKREGKEARGKEEDEEGNNEDIPEMPIPNYDVSVRSGSIAPDQNIPITFKEPYAALDSTKFHFFTKQDTTWIEEPYLLLPTDDNHRSLMLYAEWKPGKEYKLKVDSTAIQSIYGLVSDAIDVNIKVRDMSEFSTLFVNVNLPLERTDTAYAQLMDSNDKVVKTIRVEDGKAEFYYITPATYYLRLFVDNNGNRTWDTGNYDERRQAEAVYYYPNELALKADWEIEQTWNVLSTPIYEQKPEKITKQKPDKEKTVQNKNAEREKNKRK